MPLAAYFNLDMNDMDVEAVLTVSRGFEGKDDIRSCDMPDGKFLSSIH
jgi:hypothetical protein